MKPVVYVETSVISYLTARTSSNLMTAARQAWTREWWEVAPQHWVIKISDLVLDEAAKGDPSAARRRLDAMTGLDVLSVTEEAHDLARQIIKLGALPSSETEDALHIATASLYEARFLLTSAVLISEFEIGGNRFWWRISRRR